MAENSVLAMLKARAMQPSPDAMPDEAAPSDDEADEADPMTAAAQEFMDAMEAHDPAALGAAFKAMFDACEAQPHQEEGAEGAVEAQE